MYTNGHTITCETISPTRIIHPYAPFVEKQTKTNTMCNAVEINLPLKDGKIYTTNYSRT